MGPRNFIDRGQFMDADHGRVRHLLVTAVVAVSATMALGAATALASTGLVRVGSKPVLPASARTTGALAATKRLQLTIALQPQDPAGLQALATAVSTPGSPEFRHYLTVPQFAQQFGATPVQISTVESALAAQGMSVGTPTANDLTLPVTGTAAQVEKAFSVSENQVQLPGRTAYANAQAPVLPSAVGRYVQGVIGLDDVTPDQPAGLSRQTRAMAHPLPQGDPRANVPTGGGPQPCSSATAEQAMGGLTADEVATAYQFPGIYGAGDLGAGQTIAMFEEQSYNPTDIAEYQACYGTSATVANVDVAGGPTPGGDDGESSLDIEQAIGLAPKANILVYEGPFTATVQIISTIVSQNVAKVISSSYGVCEVLTGGATINAESPLLQEAAVQGQSFFISSGDSGSNMCWQATADTTQDTSLSVIDPGGQPFATGVGGTSLLASQGGQEVGYQPGLTPLEAVWNDPSSTDQQGQPHLSGSGGGISKFFTMPPYQSSAPASLGVTNPNSSTVPCGGATLCREVPDVSANADPNTGYAVFSNGAWGITGGTSAAAPLWAAFTALTNASAACRGQSVGFVNTALYQLAGSSYLNNFTDITTASPFSGQANNDALYEFNVPDNPNDLFPLATGYDMATGLGSMLAPHLAGALCGIRSPAYSVGVASPGAQTTTVGQAVGVQVHGADSGGAALAFSATGLPAGLAINPANGVISGTPTTAQATTVTVTAADQFTNAGSTQFPWTVLTPPPPPPPVGNPITRSVKFSGLSHGKPKLTFTIGAGSNAPALKSVSIKLPGGFGFASKTKTLDKGIVIKSGGRKLKFKVKLSRGTLTISFKSAVRSASVTLARPAISISRSEAAKIRRHKVKTLTVDVRTTDAANRGVTFAIKLGKLS